MLSGAGFENIEIDTLAADAVDGGITRLACAIEYLHEVVYAQSQHALRVVRGSWRQLKQAGSWQGYWAVETGCGHFWASMW